MAYSYSPHIACTKLGGTCPQPTITKILYIVVNIFFLPNQLIKFNLFINYPSYLLLDIIVAIVYLYLLACIINQIILLFKKK